MKKNVVIGLICFSLYFPLVSFVFAASDVFREVTTTQPKKITAAFFGMHAHRLVLNMGEKRLLTNWPKPQIGSLRLWDSGVRWADVAPIEGMWNFERMDTYVDLARANGADVLYVFGSTPRWASSRPDEPCPYGSGCSAAPSNTATWEDYVRRVALRYRGKITAYEIWNEPFFSEVKSKKGPSDFFFGPVGKMVEFAKIARRVLDQVDPNALLVTPGFTGNPSQLELFLSSGGKQFVQIIAYHFYAQNSREFARELSDVRAVMKRQGVQNLPLWNTETGIEVLPTVKSESDGRRRTSRLDAANLMAQYLTLGAASGISRYYYYAWDNDLSGMISPQGERLPALNAFEKMQTWLIGATMHGCESMPAESVRCEGEKGGQRFIIAWSERQGMRSIRIADGYRVRSVERLQSVVSEEAHIAKVASSIELGPEPIRILIEKYND